MEKRIPELDEVRQWIEDYVKKVANLKDQRGKLVELLFLRDAIQEWLHFYRERGAFLDPEETRVGNFDALLEKNAPLFVRLVEKDLLRRERERVNPPREHFWWWLDEKVKREKSSRMKRSLTLLSIVGVLLVSLYFFVFRLPPNEQKYLNALGRVEQLIGEEKWEEALASCKEAILLFPERPTPYVISACIEDKRGHEEEAQNLFAQAEKLYAKRVDFLLDKAMWYFRINFFERSYVALSGIFQEDPENLSALNLLGTLYETEGKVVEAIKVYERLLELAEAKEELSLIPMVKMKIGMLQLRLPLSLP